MTAFTLVACSASLLALCGLGVFVAGCSNSLDQDLAPASARQVGTDQQAIAVQFLGGDGVVAHQVVVARVDLASPDLDVVTTSELVAPGDGATTRSSGRVGEPQAKLIRTSRWAAEHSVSLAINANYFGYLNRAKKGEGEMARVIGLLASGGRVVHPARDWQGATDPAILFVKSNDKVGMRARVIGPPLPPLPPLPPALASSDGVPLDQGEQLVAAVAGVGGSETEPDRGTLLVQAGQNKGDTARVVPEKAVARTAIGVDRSGRYVTIVVVGGSDGLSGDEAEARGMTLSQLGELMISLGVWDAVNLDGGGSSTIVYRKPDGTWFNNRTGGFERPVPVQLGFRASGEVKMMQAGRS